MNRVAIILLLTLALSHHASAQDQDPWDKYKARTLKEIINSHASKVFDNPDIITTSKDGNLTIVLARDTFPSQVKVTYTATSRNISPARKELLKHWLITTYGKDDFLKLFDTEFLFTEGLAEYWIPTQKQLIPHIEKELKKGDKVTLFVAWIGARKELNKIDWMFLANEFEKE